MEFASPVYRRSNNPNDIVFVLNRLIIEFVDGVGEASAQSFLTPLNSQYGVRIVEKLGYTKPRVGYLLETSAGDGNLGPVQLAQIYYEKGNSGDSKLVYTQLRIWFSPANSSPRGGIRPGRADLLDI